MDTSWRADARAIVTPYVYWKQPTSVPCVPKHCSTCPPKSHSCMHAKPGLGRNAIAASACADDTRAARRLRGSFGEVSWKVPSRLGRFPTTLDVPWRRDVAAAGARGQRCRAAHYVCLAWIRSLFPSATAITPVRPLIVCSAAEDTHNGKQSSRCTVMRRARPRVRRTRRGCYSAGACASVRAGVPRRMGSGIGPAHAPAEGKMRRRSKKTIKEANKRAHAGNMSMSQP